MTDLFFLDVDTQVDFMKRSGRLFVSGADKIIGNLKLIMSFALKSHIPILSTADTHTPNDQEFMLFPMHCVKGTTGHTKIDQTSVPGSVVFPVRTTVQGRPHAAAFACHSQVIIEKPKLDIFSSPHTARLLSVLPKETVVFGVATDYCVRLASLGLRRRKYGVTVVRDAIAGVAPDSTRKALAEMRRAGVRFTTTRNLLRALAPR